MSNVIQFPKITRLPEYEPSGYRINLYTEDQIELVLFCVNICEDQDSTKKYARKDLKNMDPVFVMVRMNVCLDNKIISTKAKEAIFKIVNSIEVIPISSLQSHWLIH